MPIIQNLVKGVLKINTLVERECFTGWIDFLERLPDIISVEVPASVSGVIFSQEEPSEDNRNKIWVRQSPSGGVIGTYLFQDGAWNKLFTDYEFDVKWQWGDSENPEPGYITILPGDSQVPSYVVDKLVATYVPKPVGTGYAYFAKRFVGY